MGSVRLLLDFILRGTETFSCGMKRAAQKQHRRRRALGFAAFLRTDGLPCRHHCTTNQARPFRRAARAVKAHRASLTNRCKPANIASCSCAAACWCAATGPPPSPNPIPRPARAHRRAASSNPHPLLPAVRYGGAGEDRRRRRDTPH